MDADAPHVSWRDYVDTRLTAMEHAINVAKNENDRRLEGMNEFRESLRDQAARLVTRNEWDQAHTRVLEDIRSLRESRACVEGKASQQSVMVSYALGVLGLLIAVISLILHITK